MSCSLKTLLPMMIASIAAAAFFVNSAIALQDIDGAETTDAADPKWESLLADIDVERDSVSGVWRERGEELQVQAANGARLQLERAPTNEYDFRVSFTRETGSDSIALIFPTAQGQASFEVDAWGEHLGGIQNVDGQSIRENPTRRNAMTLRNGERHEMLVEVRRDKIRALLDGRPVSMLKTTDIRLSMVELWALRDTEHLGIGAWNATTTFHSIEYRDRVSEPAEVAAAEEMRDSVSPGEPVEVSAVEIAVGGVGASGGRPSPPVRIAEPEVPGEPVETPRTGKVLIVIANHHFFYREYAEPREELERAGYEVVVAAGRRAVCRPHPGSGQGAGSGDVRADIAIDDVNAEEFDAILFSGGWGSSAYQFAFEGRYDDAAYNGDRAVKRAVNALIGDFIEQDKYVCALCNGVSVLAWARVDGKSPLEGKRVCAPVREAAAGIYEGRRAQPSCRWHPEANGAVMSPPGSIGRPGTAEDDVSVDGKIVTGEDDISAREMGRTIVRLLSESDEK